MELHQLQFQQYEHNHDTWQKKETMPIATIDERECLKTTIRLNTITDILVNHLSQL